jgi:fibronectin-binding autotransporter adhesin
MWQIRIKWTSVAVVGLVMTTGFAVAAEYTWISGGADTNWTTPENWQGGTGFPGASGDIATLSAADTVNLNTNGVLSAGRLQFSSSTPKTVTVIGEAGAGLTFSGIVAPGTGINVGGHADNLLVVAPDVVNPDRIDKMGAGSLELTGSVTCSLLSGGYSLVLGQGKTILSGSSVLTAANSIVGVGNAGYVAELRLTNSAALNAKTLQLGVSANPSTEGHLWQDSDDCSATVDQVIIGNLNAGRMNAFYHLRKGTLTATGITVGFATAGSFEQSGGRSTIASLTVKEGSFEQSDGASIVSSLAVKGASFEQSGGTSDISAFAIGTTNIVASVMLSGGRMLLNGDLTTPWIADKQAFDFSGGTLQVTNSRSVYIPVRVSGTPTFDTPSGGLTLRASLSGDADIVKTGSAGLGFQAGMSAAFSGSLTISNGYFGVGSNMELESYDHSTEPLAVKICNGAVFRLVDITSIVTVPLALDIDAGGTIDFANPAGVYNRGLMVAHSIVTNGVSLPPGRYTTADGFITGVNTACSVVIPIVWTGAGDGVSWSDAANWAGGVVPNGTAAVADLSNAQQPVQIDSAVTLTALVYNPQGVKRSLTLTGSGSVTISIPGLIHPCMFVGPGRSLTFDVDLDNTPDNSTFGIVGNGEIIIKKGYPEHESYGAAVSLYGKLVFAGPLTLNKLIGLWRHEKNGNGSVILTNGCQLTCMRLMNNPGGFYPMNQVYHDGGNVTCGDVFFTRHNGDPAAPFAYYMRSGTLTTENGNGICLGVFYSSSMTRYSGGSFVMSGGTVTTPRLARGQPGTLFDLHGGDLFLGSGGIVMASPATPEGTELGGVAIHATANWSSLLPIELTGVDGTTLIDTAGHTVNLSGALSGVGGLNKSGAGTLNILGATNTFTGPLVVSGGTLACGAASVFDGVSEIIVTNGTLNFGGSILNSDITLRVAGTGTLILSAGNTLEVDRLYLNGSLRPAGTYVFGAGTVTVVPTTEIIWTGAAADGALWSTMNNWSNTVAIPDGADVTLHFGYSQLAADDQIVLDVTPGVTLTNLTYDQGLPGSVLTITCPEVTTNTLTFSGNAEICVGEGQTLILDTDVYLSGHLDKTGAGTLILRRHTSSGSTYGSVTLFVKEGQMTGQGEISNLRVQPSAASLLIDPPEFILEGPDAVLHNAAIPLPGYLDEGSDRGVFRQTGGTVDLTVLPGAFAAADVGFMIAGGGGTRGVYELEGGELITCPTEPAYISGNSADGTFNQSGGTATFYQLSLTRPWPTTGGNGVMNFSGGRLCLSGTVKKGYSPGFVNLSGGQVESLTDGPVFEADVPVALATGVSGDVSFSQAQVSYTSTLIGTLSGSGGLVQAGPGTLTLDGNNAFSGALGITGGTLLINTELPDVTELYADGGHLELLAGAPALTNLAVQAAGATIRIVSEATPFGENLTLNLAQGIVTELDFAGIVEVDRLVLAGTAKTPGLYGGTESAAPDKPSSVYFTGAGTLRVLNGPAPSGTLILVR